MTKQDPNHLIHEKSPYLLQHAYNPVNWYPWGDDAFEKAKWENKPILLSIGYSTCHWCHVMKRESFEDDDVASELNNHYVAIKVDREERPDIDGIYMKVCQMMNGQGGWPLTIFMTPDKVPFYAAMYLPKTSRYGMPGMMDALPQLRQKYHEDPGHIAEVTRSVTDALDRSVTSMQNQQLAQKDADEAFEQLQLDFDTKYGGFGSAPKFPQPQQMLFLLRYYYFTGNQAALDMTETTLRQMAAGGIYDQIGFGFARYATDAAWLVPHFEKMLHDNALLLTVYAETYQVTQDPWYRQKAAEIIEFIEREMTSKDGAFYSAIDAETEGEEGKYYVWEFNEIMDVLGNELGKLYTDVFNITEEGNFSGRNIPNLLDTDIEAVAAKHEIDTDTLHKEIESARKQLMDEREKRVYPHVDDKVLTSWNALMIAGLAKAGKAFDQPDYIATAKKAVDFIETHMFDNGRLMARYRDGETKYKGYIDDYAYLLWAYVELYDATYDMQHLKQAKQLLDDMLDLFWDKDNGGFYFTGSDAETLISREKQIVEGALPSGNSAAAVMLVHMAYLTGDTTYLDRAEDMHTAFYKAIDLSPAAGSFFLQSVLLMENTTKEVVIFGNGSNSDRNELTANLQKTFLPDVHVLAAEDPEQFKEISDFAAAYTPIGDDATVYICENFACRAPQTDVTKAFQLIAGYDTDGS